MTADRPPGLREAGFFWARLLLVLLPAAIVLIPVAALGSLTGWWALLAAPLVAPCYFPILVLELSLLARWVPPVEVGLFDDQRDLAGYQRAMRQFRHRDVLEGTIYAFGLDGWLSAWPSLMRALLRAFGADVGQAVAVAPRVELTLPSHLQLGPGAYLGWGSYLSPVLQLSLGHLLIEPVAVGAGSFVGAGCRLGPGSRLGVACILGAESTLAGQIRLGSEVRVRGMLRADRDVEIGGGSMLGYGVTLHRGCRLGFAVRLGSHVTIGRGARVGDDCRLGNHVTVAAGACLPARTRVPGGTHLPASDFPSP